MAYLEPLTNLKQLQVCGSAHITDAGIAHLKNLKNLSEVQISNTAVTYHCVETFKQLPHLKRITISFQQIGDQGMQIIQKSLDQRVKVHDGASDLPLEMFAPLHSPIAPQNANPLQ
jgi:2-C-methyl-D-erythritol 4-phosphate cytidylyltransferase